MLCHAVPEWLARVCELFPPQVLSLLSSVQQRTETLTSCLGTLAWRNQPSCSPRHLQLPSPEKYRLVALGLWLGVPLVVSRVKRLLVLGWGAVSSQAWRLHPTIQQSKPHRAELHFWPLVDLGFFPLREMGSWNKDPLLKVTAEGRDVVAGGDQTPAINQPRLELRPDNSGHATAGPGLPPPPAPELFSPCLVVARDGKAKAGAAEGTSSKTNSAAQQPLLLPMGVDAGRGQVKPSEEQVWSCHDKK